MSKLTKKQKILQEKLDPEKVYSIDEAMEIMQSVKSDKFDESVDISIKLGVDPNKSDQNVRGAVTLPNSLGTVSYTHLRAHETREERGWRGLV